MGNGKAYISLFTHICLIEMARTNKKGNAGIVILIIILLLLGIGGYVLFKSGAVSEALDPCESRFNECNHGCGEGILSSLCKEKCTYNYNSCRGK